MALTEQQYQELKAAAKPLMDWLLRNCHPHTTAIVDNQLVEVLEGVAVVNRKEFATIASSNP
jgi:hypothetical protein